MGTAQRGWTYNDTVCTKYLTHQQDQKRSIAKAKTDNVVCE